MGKLPRDEVAEIWKMNDPGKGVMEFGFKAGEGPTLPKKRPHWMLNYSRTWPDPQGPIICLFTLKKGFEQSAIDFLYNDNENLDIPQEPHDYTS